MTDTTSIPAETEPAVDEDQLGAAKGLFNALLVAIPLDIVIVVIVLKAIGIIK